MFVIAYRNSNGFLRVDNAGKVWDTRKAAVAYAKFCSHGLGITCRVLDYEPEIKSYEPGGDNFDWRANGWYCQHSYEFCSYCFSGADHPADEQHDYEDTDWIEANSAPLTDPMYGYGGDNRQ